MKSFAQCNSQKFLAKTYANKASAMKFLINKALWLVNVSKPNFPRYLPMPLWPTPPNGSVSTINTSIREKNENSKFNKTSKTHRNFSLFFERNGSCIQQNLLINWNVTSFTVTEPLDVSAYSCRTFFAELVKR